MCDGEALKDGCRRVSEHVPSLGMGVGVENASRAVGTAAAETAGEGGRYRCAAGLGCAEETMMCVHHGGGHFMSGMRVNTFDEMFGTFMMDAVFEWLARQASNV